MTYFYVYPFGSTEYTDIDTSLNSDGVVSYQQGYTVNYQQDLVVDPTTALPIERLKFNGLMYEVTLNLQQYQTIGTPFWITASQNLGVSYPYGLYARTAYDAGSGLQIWESQVSSNTSTPGADNNWIPCNVAAIANPPGTIIDFAGSSVPTGYLLCNGATVLITDYPNLYAAIGLLWQPLSPPPSGYFNLPNLQTRVCAGSGGAGIPTPTGTIVNVGDIGGSATTNQLINHTHTATLLVYNGTNTPSVNPNSSGTTGLSYTGSSSHSLQWTAQGTTNSTGTGASVTIVQATAMTLKCIKY